MMYLACRDDIPNNNTDFITFYKPYCDHHICIDLLSMFMNPSTSGLA